MSQALSPEGGCSWNLPCQSFLRDWGVKETTSPGGRARQLGDGRGKVSVVAIFLTQREWLQGTVEGDRGILIMVSVPPPECNEAPAL